MRFLQLDSNNEISLTKDLPDHDLPARYAILSHTWSVNDEDEVTFADLEREACHYRSKAGYKKIEFCGEQARRDGITHFWVDTCCIDKTNHVELSEAIISMYRWYKMASVCYVYLPDVAFRPQTDGNEVGEYQIVRSWKPAFRKSRWFTRGWTLQELIAPDSAIFFSEERICLGTKSTLEELIHEITDVPVNALRGRILSNFSIAERMRWTQYRTTKRREDQAYCLFGIFNVFLPLMYGEGDNAFVRLNEEINKQFKVVSMLKTVDHCESETSEQAHQGLVPKYFCESEQQNGRSNTATTSEGLLQERKKRLLDSLSFEQMGSRRSTVKSAYASTCTWILQHSAYLNWIDPQQLKLHLGFLWINGKPGAGKSTMMKYIHSYTTRTKSENEIVISFFFNARGDILERSTIGMYRGLLFELLQKATDLKDFLDTDQHCFYEQSQYPIWTAESLQALLSAAVIRLQQTKLKIFIDALDECDEVQIREMVVFVEQLALDAFKAGGQLHICFASRHYPTIDIRNGQKLILEDEDGHSEDLVKYVHSHLRAGTSGYIEEIRKEILQKANCIFMWAVLVVDVLNEEFRRGRIFAVRKRLKEIPTKLSDLFKDILRRDSINMTDMLLCLQWILFAKRPLRREEFYFAMVTVLDPGLKPTEWDPALVTIEAMDNFIISSSKGLAELTKSKTPTVQFIHESIKDFLIKDNGLSELWPDHAQDLHSSSHDQLKRCCQDYLSADISMCIQPSETLPKANSETAKKLRQTLKDKFPFLEYASQYVLYHADEAASEIPQEDFLVNFDLRHWLYTTNIFAIYEVRRHTLNASLLYVLAENNSARLLAANCLHTSILSAERERYQFALAAALTNGHRDAVQALLQREGYSQAGDVVARLRFGAADPPRKDQTLLAWALSRDDEALAQVLAAIIPTMSTAAMQDLEVIDRYGNTALVLAVTKGSEKVVRLLCDCHVNIEASDNDGRTALHYAVEKGSETITRILLVNKANAEARDLIGTTPLQLAAQRGNITLVQLLLGSNADIEAQNKQGETAVILAAMEGHRPVVQLLLQQGSETQRLDFGTGKALLRAARQGRKTAVQFLLGEGTDIETRDQSDNTPLILAAKNKMEIVLQLLLTEGADIEARDSDGRTSLSYAASYGHKQMVDILMAWNANPAARDLCGKTPFLRMEDNFVRRKEYYERERSALLMHQLTENHALPDYQTQLIFLEQSNKRRLMMARSASSSDLLEMTKLMLGKLSKHDDIISYCNTALIWAAKYGREDLAQSLLLDRANTSAKDQDGLIALWHAILHKQYPLVKVLVAHNADIEQQNPEGMTPLAFAYEEKDDHCVAALLNCEVDVVAWNEIQERLATHTNVCQRDMKDEGEDNQRE